MSLFTNQALSNRRQTAVDEGSLKKLEIPENPMVESDRKQIKFKKTKKPVDVQK